MSTRTDGRSLWLVRPMDGDVIRDGEEQLFAGSVSEMLAHIAELHARTGRQHAATEA